MPPVKIVESQIYSNEILACVAGSRCWIRENLLSAGTKSHTLLKSNKTPTQALTAPRYCGFRKGVKRGTAVALSPDATGEIFREK